MQVTRRFGGITAGILVLTIVSTATAQYGGGSGTKDDPYQIWTVGQLNAIGTEPNDWDKHFKLMADIDYKKLRGAPTNVIGVHASYGRPFSGVFNGNGKTIANFTCSRTGTTSLGLFAGVQGPDALIKNLILKGAVVNAGTGGTAGALVGYLHSGTVSRCHVDGGSVSGGFSVGGLIGICEGAVVDCSSSASVSASDTYAGGLIGNNARAGAVTASYATGQVSSRSHAAGLVAENLGEVRDCYSTSQTTATKGYAGGLAAFCSGTIRNCYSMGRVSAPATVGGFVAAISGRAPVSSSFWDVQTSGQSTSTGGIGMSTAQMKTAATFIGWDFMGTWAIQEGVDYPRLQWEADPLPSPVATTVEKVSGDDQYATIGSTPALPLAVRVRDQEGDGMADVPVDFIVTAGDATVEPASAVTDAAGVASAKLTLGLTPGFIQVRAAVGSLFADFTIEARSWPVATTIEKVSGDNQYATAGSKLSLPLTVRVKDQFGQGFADAEVDFVVMTGDSTVKPASAVTDANGLASAVLTLGPTPGTTQVRAAVDALSADFNITGLTTGYVEGTGAWDDPYLIYTADQLNTLGTEPNDWDKYFKLMGDIDLSGFSYDRALVAGDVNTAAGGFQGTAFTGVFDGAGHSISHLTITGKDNVGLFGRLNLGGLVTGVILRDVRMSGGNCVAGLVGESQGDVTQCCVTGSVSGSTDVGGIVGHNNGYVTQSCSAAAITGSMAGGLAGINWGTVAQSYSTGSVKGSFNTGGLVGWNAEFVIQCYSTGVVTGTFNVGGLVGDNLGGTSIASFWNTQTSGRVAGGGGTGRTTSQMQSAATFLDAGWDFAGETANGTVDMWRIDEGQGYPHLWWEALSPGMAAVIDEMFGPRIQPDQTNLPNWTGGWTLLWSKSGGKARMWQTFKPGASSIAAAAIDIMSGNPFFGDDTLTVDIAKDGVTMASAARTVQAGYNGLLRFQFENPVPVTIGGSYELRVSAKGGTFGWKCGLNTYSGGMRYFNSQADPTGDWFFQTYSPAPGD